MKKPEVSQRHILTTFLGEKLFRTVKGDCTTGNVQTVLNLLPPPSPRLLLLSPLPVTCPGMESLPSPEAIPGEMKAPPPPRSPSPSPPHRLRGRSRLLGETTSFTSTQNWTHRIYCGPLSPKVQTHPVLPSDGQDRSSRDYASSLRKHRRKAPSPLNMHHLVPLMALPIIPCSS